MGKLCAFFGNRLERVYETEKNVDAANDTAAEVGDQSRQLQTKISLRHAKHYLYAHHSGCGGHSGGNPLAAGTADLWKFHDANHAKRRHRILCEDFGF